jgi:hypothetical protein
MEGKIERKCNACKNAIEIDRSNVQGVVYYKKLYYHTTCFCELAEKRATLKSGRVTDWKSALDNVEDLERAAKEIITHNRVHQSHIKRDTDDLNDYLLKQYNVEAVSSSNFWRSVNELQNGFYKGRRCKKVPIEILLEAWKWGQRKLDAIHKQNQMRHKGPTNGEARISYDFAVLVGKIPNYLAYKAKQEAAQAEIKTAIRINYDNMQRTEGGHEGLDDISDLLDEF